MRITLNNASLAVATLAVLGTASCIAAPPAPQPASVAPATMPRVGTVDARFQSYNIEMVEVTGGRFWKPYASNAATPPAAPAAGNQPAGIDPGLFEYRKPIDLSNPRLRKLAAALGPAYLRVSGTWANTTFFQDSDDLPPATPPKGFNGVLTRKQWKGVVDFSKAANAAIVTSFAISPGTRDAAGAWTPEQARQIFDYTKSLSSTIAAAEFMNEPNIAAIGGAPKGYDAKAYGRDVAIFRREDGVAENFHTAQNRDLLQKLADETGGRYYSASNAAKLADEISYSEAGITTRETKDLWDMPIIFLLALLLRGSEWMLRRRWGVV